jgi:hypothetical protein
MIVSVIFLERLPAQLTRVSGFCPQFIIRVSWGEGAHLPLRVLPDFMIQARIPPLEITYLQKSILSLVVTPPPK